MLLEKLPFKWVTAICRIVEGWPIHPGVGERTAILWFNRWHKFERKVV